MKKNNLNEKRAGYVIACIVAIIVIAFFILIGSEVNAQVKTGYMVMIDRPGRVPTGFKTQNKELVNKTINQHLQTTDFKISQALANQNFFETRINGKRVYVELKKIVKKGGKVKYATIRKRDKIIRL